MTYYRILSRLSYRGGFLEPDTIQNIKLAPDKLTILTDLGTIALIHAPPLAVLPGWAERAAQLGELGIVTVTDLLEADPQTLIDSLAQNRATIEAWTCEALRWLQVKDEHNARNCDCL